jgi:hypothetical protein
MRSPLRLVRLALCALAPTGGQLSAQAGAPMTREETEAQSMGLQMAFACNPRRQGEVQGSGSTVRRATDALSGTAILSRTAEGTFLSLEQYDDALEGHCLVFGWFGGDLALGRYPIKQLSYRAMEDELASGERSFYTWGAVRTSGESTMLMTRSGTVQIIAIEGGRVRGTFELAGTLVEGSAHAGEVSWAGSFDAVEME